MNESSEAAEQVVRIALSGTEVALRLTGTGAKNVAAMLVAAAASAEKTRGKTRLAAMLKQGKELKVFTIRPDDLKTFAEEAKRYGIVYAVVKQKDGSGPVDLLVRAEDASKVNRISEKHGFARVNPEGAALEQADPEQKASKSGTPQASETSADELLDELLGAPTAPQGEKEAMQPGETPPLAHGPAAAPSGPISEGTRTQHPSGSRTETRPHVRKASVRARLKASEQRVRRMRLARGRNFLTAPRKTISTERN